MCNFIEQNNFKKAINKKSSQENAIYSGRTASGKLRWRGISTFACFAREKEQMTAAKNIRVAPSLFLRISINRLNR